MLVVNGKEYREISNLTVNGNKKIGRGVGHFSTTPTNENGGHASVSVKGAMHARVAICSAPQRDDLLNVPTSLKTIWNFSSPVWIGN